VECFFLTGKGPEGPDAALIISGGDTILHKGPLDKQKLQPNPLILQTRPYMKDRKSNHVHHHSPCVKAAAATP
jgi:hypothetical protein